MGESNSNYISYAISNKCPDDCGRCNICIANNIWVCPKEHRGKLSKGLSYCMRKMEIEEIEKLHNICSNKEIAEFLYKYKCLKPYYKVKDTYNTYDYFLIKCYGITQKPNTKEYLMVIEYANGRDLRNYLLKNYKEFTWNDKINSLHSISTG
ncbi:25605_t:CDS:2, partial [Gigaspora margarita]